MRHVTALLLLAFQLSSGFKTFHIVEEDRHIPAWTSYMYKEVPKEDLIIREYILQEQDQRTYLMCPEGFVIGQLNYALLLGNEQVEKDPNLKHKQAVYKHRVGDELPSDQGDRVENHLTPDELCPTLAYCLMYQACVFNFGNELCLKDPNPGTRKNIDTNITCVRDEKFSEHLRISSFDDNLQKKFNENKDRVLNIMYDSKLDYGIEDFENTKLTFRVIDEDFVFNTGCSPDPYEAGFRGECSDMVMTNNSVAQNTWHLSSRVTKPVCKAKVVEVFCAFQYSPEGKCVPPHLVRAGRREEWFQAEVFNNAAYPQVGERPVEDIMVHQMELLRHKNRNLVPARIGFALLVHKDVPIIVQLLQSIYRPHHFYVIHVDKRKEDVRKELMRQLKQSLPSFNIRVLPRDRSFITSWGSMGIVRAHLEQFEELCRMGIWDFVINMSGADLNIRGVDDLSMALAPYRGHNFFAFHGNVRNEDLTKDQGLCWEAWYECDGFTYNITRTAGQPTSKVLEIKTTSQWATLSRTFVEHLLDQESHSHIWRTFDFHMQTSVIPDESYLSTFALNSPMKSKTHHVGLYWLKRFSGQTRYNLCKHLGDADFCGQGPSDIDSSDLGEVADMTHRYFFARKFNTVNKNDEVRMMANKMSSGEYYKVLGKYIPTQIIYQLMQNAYRYLQLQNTIDQKIPRTLKLDKLHIFPVLHPLQPCCSLPFERHYKSIQEFSYVLDFHARAPHGEPVSMRAKYNFYPQCICYPRGHLRAVRVTGWTEEGSDDKRALSINTPFPYHPAGSKSVFGELWFHASDLSISPQCRDTSHEMIGDVAEIDNIGKDEKNELKGDTLVLIANLIDPEGKTRCTERVEIAWNKKEVKDDVERAAFLTMACGIMEAGKWKLTLQKANVQRPYIYEVDMLFMSLGEDMDKLSSQPDIEQVDLLQGMWSIDQVTQLPLPDFYQDQQRASAPFTPRKDEEHKSRHKRSAKERSLFPNQPFHLTIRDWIVCSGGLITLVMTALFSYHTLYLPLKHPSRYQTRALYYTVSLVLLSSLVQTILCSFYC